MVDSHSLSNNTEISLWTSDVGDTERWRMKMSEEREVSPCGGERQWCVMENDGVKIPRDKKVLVSCDNE